MLKLYYKFNFATEPPSMYQDLIVNNRKTEIDYINGAVATLGKQRHIEAPVNRFITDLIHTKESQRHAQD
ncbi:hypothetical protein JMUB7528_19470 [Staphylococcus aureus]